MNKFNIIPSLKESEYEDLVNIANGELDITSLNPQDYEYMKTFISISKYDYWYCKN